MCCYYVDKNKYLSLSLTWYGLLKSLISTYRSFFPQTSNKYDFYLHINSLSDSSQLFTRHEIMIFLGIGKYTWSAYIGICQIIGGKGRGHILLFQDTENACLKLE